MIEVTLKLILIVILLFIFYQDTKDRLVYWFLYPLVAILACVLQIKHIGFISAIINAGISLTLILLILVVSALYAAIVTKKRFLNESIGLGDILFFVCLPFTFATISFIVVFVFSLFFSLLLHLTLSSKQTDKTVPLAGYIALFFGMVYTISFFTESKYLFSY